MSSVADLVVARLREAGVRCVFGMPGGGSNLDLVAACARAALPFVLTATETGAAIAALAQAEITGRPGACLTTQGPGVTSVVNGVACARLERAPILVFTDAPAAGTSFEHQRLEHRALLAPVTKWSAAIDARNAADVLASAIACAMSEPRGPVHIDCPADILGCECDPPDMPDPPDPHRSADAFPPRGGADPRVNQARKPLLLVGLGAREAQTASAIRALCATRRVPAMVTYKAKGVVADHDPWFAGLVTNGAIERPVIEQADLLIAVGLDAVELLPRPWTYTPPLMQVEPADVSSLAHALPVSSWDATAAQRAVEHQRAGVCVPAGALAPHRVVQIAAAAAPHARVTVDAGAHMLPATMLWPIDAPNGMLISNGLSTMGFALPAAIGAALIERGPAQAGHHDCHTVALTGDGGLLICAGELATAARERARLVVVVFNDASLSLIDIKQRQRQLPRDGVGIGAIDWRSLADSVGVRGHAASTEEELAAAIAAALVHDGPSLIDVQVDPAGYPAILKAMRG